MKRETEWRLFQLHSTFEHGVVSVQSFLLTVHLNRESNLESKTLTTSKLKELQGPKVRLKLPLLGAPIPPKLMRFRCTIMKKCRRNISQHTCMHDDLYHPCTFAWGQCQTRTTPNLKELQRSKSRCKQLLLAATTTPNFVELCCMVPKKWHQTLPHTGRWPSKTPIFCDGPKKKPDQRTAV